jgi:hypothetical protein
MLEVARKKQTLRQLLFKKLFLPFLISWAMTLSEEY